MNFCIVVIFKFAIIVLRQRIGLAKLRHEDAAVQPAKKTTDTSPISPTNPRHQHQTFRAPTTQPTSHTAGSLMVGITCLRRAQRRLTPSNSLCTLVSRIPLAPPQSRRADGPLLFVQPMVSEGVGGYIGRGPLPAGGGGLA